MFTPHELSECVHAIHGQTLAMATAILNLQEQLQEVTADRDRLLKRIDQFIEASHPTEMDGIKLIQERPGQLKSHEMGW